MAKLECSKSTLHRAINALKDHLNAPVVFDAEPAATNTASPRAKRTSCRASGSRRTSCKRSRSCSDSLRIAGGGLLEEHSGALAKRLDELTKHQHLNLGEAAQRLRFPAIAARPAGAAFNTVA